MEGPAEPEPEPPPGNKPRAEGRPGGGGELFPLGHGNVCFSSPRTGCGHVNHPGGKSEGPKCICWFLLKKGRKKDNNLCGWLKSILITNEQGKNKPPEQAGVWPGDLRRKARRGPPGRPPPGSLVQKQPVHRACVQGHRDLPRPTPTGTHSPPMNLKAGVCGGAWGAGRGVFRGIQLWAREGCSECVQCVCV